MHALHYMSLSLISRLVVPENNEALSYTRPVKKSTDDWLILSTKACWSSYVGKAITVVYLYFWVFVKCLHVIVRQRDHKRIEIAICSGVGSRQGISLRRIERPLCRGTRCYLRACCRTVVHACFGNGWMLNSTSKKEKNKEWISITAPECQQDYLEDVWKRS